MFNRSLFLTSTASIAVCGLAVTALATPVPGMPEARTGERPLNLIHAGHHGAAQGSGIVKTVDAEQHKITLSHGAVKAIGWPAMTSDFAVNPSVDLSAIKPESKVNFSLVRAPDGSYQVDAVQPAAEQR